eukprot:m.245938 g.245938  ORF g.245938 m.245938 type:complete len:200 (-) comp14854_c0_seq1:145-744(-)
MAAAGLPNLVPDAEVVTKALVSGNKLASELLRKATALQSRLQMIEQEDGKIQELNKLSGRTGEKSAADESSRQAEWLSEVQQENAELRGLVDEMQAALDLIMVKHRKQVSSLTEQQKNLPAEREEALQREKRRADLLEQEVVILTGRVQEMAGVMHLAAEADSEAALATSVEIERLRTENATLRDLLGIAGIPIEDVKQ